MDAAVVNVDGRPIIAICRDDKPDAKVAYKLAHELGHVAKGRWREYGFIADVEFASEDHDVTESQADAFGCGVIYGDQDFTYSSLGIEPIEIVDCATDRLIDPHALLLAYLREFGKWIKGLYVTCDPLQKELSEGQNARALILCRLLKELDSEALTAEEMRQLLVITEASDVIGTAC